MGSQQRINSCSRLRTPIIFFTVLAAAPWATYRSGPKPLTEEFLEYSIRWPVLDAPEGTDFIYSSPTGMLIFQSLGGQGPLAYVFPHALMITVAIGALAPVPVSVMLLIVANTHEGLCSGRWARVTEGLMWLGLPQPTSNYALNDLHNFILEVRPVGK